jgi:hypothetical protein
MDELDAQIVRTAESLIIVTALRQYISRLEALRTESNKTELDSLIKFAGAVLEKYKTIWKTPVKKDLKGRLFPIPNAKN